MGRAGYGAERITARSNVWQRVGRTQEDVDADRMEGWEGMDLEPPTGRDFSGSHHSDGWGMRSGGEDGSSGRRIEGILAKIGIKM